MTTPVCKRSERSWLWACLPARAATRMTNPVSKSATARANRENLLEGSKSDLKGIDVVY